jgi:hypothetical protein
LALAFNSGLIQMALIRMALAIVDMKAYTGMVRDYSCLIHRFVNLHISKFEAFVPGPGDGRKSQHIAGFSG